MSIRSLLLCLTTLLLGCVSFPVHSIEDIAGEAVIVSNTLDKEGNRELNSSSRLESLQEDITSKNTSISKNIKPKPKPDPKPLIPRSLRPSSSPTAIPTTELSTPTLNAPSATDYFVPTCILTAYPTMNSTGVSSGSAGDAADAAALSQSWYTYSVLAGLFLLLLVIFFLSTCRLKSILSFNKWEGVSNERSAMVPSTSQCTPSYQATESNQQYLLSPDKSEYKEVNYIRYTT